MLTSAVITLIAIAAVGAYAAPAVVAYLRRHPRVGLILALNLLLGWTIVGWALLLAWASAKTPEQRHAALERRRRRTARRRQSTETPTGAKPGLVPANDDEERDDYAAWLSRTRFRR